MAKALEIDNDAIYVCAVGAETPVGRNYRAAAAAVRCGICAYAEHPFMIDRQGEPMIVARADWLADELSAGQRLCELAAGALDEAMSITLHGVERVRLHLALSSELLPADAERQVVAQQLQSKLGSASAKVNLVADGHAGGLLALETAVNELHQGTAKVCFVGGVDSYLDVDRLEALDEAGRLHSIHNSWGLTPGEGAAFLMLANGKTVRSQRLTPLAQILAVATAEETKLLGTESVCLGEGLTSAFRGVLESDSQVAHSFCDLNGETYRADEFGFAVCRTSDAFQDAGSFTAAAECWGDVGAASAPLGMALSVAAWVGQYAAGEEALVWCSSAHAPARGAVRLRSVSQPEK